MIQFLINLVICCIMNTQFSLTTICPGSGYVAASPQEQWTAATDELTAKTVALSLEATAAGKQPKTTDFYERLNNNNEIVYLLDYARP